MTILYNNLSGGPDGVDITNLNSGGGEDDAFDTYNNSANVDTILKFKDASSLNRPTALYVMRVSTGSTAGAVNAGWYTSMGSQSQIWMRSYNYCQVLPDSTTRPQIFGCFDIAGGGALRYAFGIDKVGSDSLLMTEDGAGHSLYCTTPIVLQQWWRVEARVQFGSTTGNGEVRFYAEPDADLPDYTESLTFSNWTLGGTSADFFVYGWVKNLANLREMYVSGLALSNEDWIGPAPFRPGKGVPGILSSPVAIHADCR